MGQISVWQVFIVFLVLVYPIICFWRILPRAGFSRWISFLCILPLGMFIPLGLVAFSKWPVQQQSPEVFN